MDTLNGQLESLQSYQEYDKLLRKADSLQRQILNEAQAIINNSFGDRDEILIDETIDDTVTGKGEYNFYLHLHSFLPKKGIFTYYDDFLSHHGLETLKEGDLSDILLCEDMSYLQQILSILGRSKEYRPVSEKAIELNETFIRRYDQYKEHQGKRFEVIRKVTQPEKEYDRECLPMYEIKLEDGQVITAWPEEVEKTNEI